MNFVQNLKWGLRWGLTMAAGFTAIGVVATIGASFDPTPRNGPPLLSLIGFYFVAGTCGGVILGLLRPVTRHKAGAMMVGTVLAGVCLALLARIYVVKDSWTMVDTIGVVLYSLVTGPIATLMIWKGMVRKGSDSSQPEV
jgi:multisubunit Na+/H+ antiporter MnhG subunit